MLEIAGGERLAQKPTETCEYVLKVFFTIWEVWNTIIPDSLEGGNPWGL